MKKYIIAIALFITSFYATGQKEVGTWSMQPKAGIAVSSLTKFSDSMEGSSKKGFLGGVEVEYQLTSRLSLSAAFLYSMQGNKYGTITYLTPVYNEDHSLQEIISTTVKGDFKKELDYLNIPITANYYIGKNFALKTGVQIGILDVATTSSVSFGMDSEDINVKRLANKVDLSIPFGLSYEYRGLVLDARYNLGLNKIFDNPDKTIFIDGRKIGMEADWKNSVFGITLGYKFDL